MATILGDVDLAYLHLEVNNGLIENEDWTTK